MVNPDEHTVAALREVLADVDDLETLSAALEDERESQDRKTAREAIEARMDELREAGEVDEPETEGEYEEPDDADETAADEEPGDESDAADESADEGESADEAETDESADEDETDDAADDEDEDDGLSHPTRDKKHIRALQGGHYEDMWVFCETQQGELLDVSKEMLGKARELMDEYAADYGDDEQVVAYLMGDDCRTHAEEAIQYGADVAVFHDDDRLGRFLNTPYTHIASHMARGEGTFDDDSWYDYDKPRYALFPATNNGRDLSATVQAELDSGLASDCSDLFIEEEKISNPVKTGEPGEKKVFEKVLHMKRPDFSGFEYSTILCLDNPDRDFHPQGASVIPGTFDVPEPDPDREGLVVEHDMDLADEWFAVTVEESDELDEGVDLTGHDVVVCLGRGIGDAPTEGIELGLDLADAFEDAAFGITRGIVTSSYQFDGHVEQYTGEDRQIGETGQEVAPDLYVAAGVSGAVQHKVGMDESDTIVAINTNPDARIRDFSDYFVEGDLFEVLPHLIEAVESGELNVEAVADGGED
ncbi:electron transfer flavoprotein, alpha subunit [Halovivax ruber XH-70]|uniref:Electron transfer flavoprotein, alpha subunit n=1 Tax=Halovivax ruber (strain DSM 18193 / JCM 13892 / XH-70) TaxID=797302 RepID=L0ICC5_HALRX|nr:electron transfer flavoprotein subunit alpha/FixB family protein [Halovivax ruber]AGB16478.1 electron transfer flavoprotein, alpha subunit [Halovivax ruber XH-70]